MTDFTKRVINPNGRDLEKVSENLEGLIISSEADSWNILEPNRKPSATQKFVLRR